MVLDPATLALISAVIAGLQVLAFVVLARLNPEMRGVRLWAWSSLASAASMLVLVSRRIIGEHPLLYGAGFLAVTAALACTAVGAAVFVGRRPRFRIAVVATPVILGVHAWYLLVDPQPTVRIACTAAMYVVWLVAAANELFHERKPGLLVSSRFTGGVMLAYAAAVVLRSVLMAAGEGSSTMFARELPQVIAFLGTIFWVVSFTFGVILMINQRQILFLSESAAAQLQAEESLRLAERQLALVREQRQRKEFVHDLHDGVGAATVNVAHLVDLLKSRGVADTEVLEHLEHAAVEGARELRRLMNAVDEGQVRWTDWLHDLRTHAEQTLGARGIALVWRVACVPPVAPIASAAAALSFGRAVREAVANVAKHAQATQATISIRFHPGAVAVRVRDDGVGFPESPPGSQAAGRHGLVGMERRMRACGGRLRLGRRSSVASSGGSVCLVAPLPLSLRVEAEL
ncbi:MAG: ATP-binding protein [Planctomycetia bacterium]